MAELLKIRDTIRDFLRKYDEITTPLYRFVVAFITFSFLNSIYGYSDLFERGIVVFLLSVICALVSNPTMVFLAWAVILANAFSISIEVGVVYFIMAVLIYCMYIRMFPNCSWILIFVPIMFHLNLIYAVPIIVAIFAGASGIIPVFFGILVYNVAMITKDIPNLMNVSEEEENFQAYVYIVEQLHIRDMLATAVIFAVVIMITYVIYKLSFDYSWYVAIGVGGVCNILLFLLGSVMADVEVGAGPLVFGSLIGAVIACALQMCKSMVDYSRKESVQFEDDDYYYYVKAIPKFQSNRKNKDVKKITEEAVMEAQSKKMSEQRKSQQTAREREVSATSANPSRSRSNSTGTGKTSANRTSTNKTSTNKTSANRTKNNRPGRGGY